jgi:hypothetical protein
MCDGGRDTAGTTGAKKPVPEKPEEAERSCIPLSPSFPSVQSHFLFFLSAAMSRLIRTKYLRDYECRSRNGKNAILFCKRSRLTFCLFVRFRVRGAAKGRCARTGFLGFVQRNRKVRKRLINAARLLRRRWTEFRNPNGTGRSRSRLGSLRVIRMKRPSPDRPKWDHSLILWFAVRFLKILISPRRYSFPRRYSCNTCDLSLYFDNLAAAELIPKRDRPVREPPRLGVLVGACCRRIRGLRRFRWVGFRGLAPTSICRRRIHG